MVLVMPSESAAAEQKRRSYVQDVMAESKRDRAMSRVAESKAEAKRNRMLFRVLGPVRSGAAGGAQCGCEREDLSRARVRPVTRAQ